MVIYTPDSAFDFLMSIWPGELNYREKVVCLFLDSQKTVIHHEAMFVGGTNACVVDEVVILRQAIVLHAKYIVVAHNHPSGTVVPSDQDLLCAERIEIAAKILEIGVAQLIVTRNQFCVMSFFKGLNGSL